MGRFALFSDSPDSATERVVSTEDSEATRSCSKVQSCASAYIEPNNRGARYRRRRGHKFSGASSDVRHAVDVHHGEPLMDRKSKFQAHAARVKSIEQVEWVHRHLL